MDCFAEPVIRRRCAPTGWLAMTMKLSSSCRARGGFEFLAKTRQLLFCQIADGPIAEAAIAPAADIESLHRLHLRRAGFGARALRHEQVDDMLAAAVDHRADRTAIDIIQPAADQRKSLRAEIHHRRRDV